MTMIKQRSPAVSYVQPYRYSSPNIPLSAIRRFARQIAERFASLRRSLRALTPYAVNFRYPGVRATTRRMQAALRQAERVRTALRARLGLPGQRHRANHDRDSAPRE